jgi:hypothetical protein
MTAAERQARRRRRLRAEARAAERERLARDDPFGRRVSQPPHGYARAKEVLMAAGHVFERARREAGFEEGLFVDGAFLSTDEVIGLAGLSARERRDRLAELRRDTKDFAVGAVEHYMAILRVSLDELGERAGRRGAAGSPAAA